MEALDRVIEPIANVARFYFAEASQVRPSATDYGAVRDFLFDLDERSRSRGDMLAREFARTGSLSTVDPKVGYMMMLRALCAVDMIGILNDAELQGRTPLRLAQCSDAYLTEWLLVAVWHRRADNWMMLSALAISRGEGFYSGVPSSSGF